MAMFNSYVKLPEGNIDDPFPKPRNPAKWGRSLGAQISSDTDRNTHLSVLHGENA
jgi:hypothetical protein